MVLTAFIGALQRPLFACLVSGLLGATAAQGQVMRALQGSFAGHLIEPPRSVRQQLSDAEKAVAAKQYSEAVVRLGTLLSRSPAPGGDDVFEDEAGQDYFLDVDDQQPTQLARQSLMREAEDLLGRMPEEGLDTYELNYGAAAKKALDEASAARDWDGVQEVSRRYFHTKAGYQATYLWGYRALTEGRPLAATRLFSRLARQPRAADRFGGQLDVALATARRLAGRDSQEVIDAFRPLQAADRFPARSDEYRIGDQRVAAPQGGDELSWVDERISRAEKRTSTAPTEYRLFGGEADRGGLGSGEMPLSRVRWNQSTTASFPQAEQVSEVVEAMTSLGELPPPTWTPLLVGNQLVARTTDYLMGIDFKTGKRIWNDVLGPPLESSETRDELAEVSAQETREALLKQRVWNDLPYGRISSDGQRVFVLDGLEQLEITNFNQFGGLRFRGTRRADTSTNTLKALELATEGKLLWKIGADELDPTPLTDAFFLGPPLPLDGRLYVIAELAGDISLLCLDPATGQELWRQQLLAIEAGGIDMDPVRRVAGAMPAYQDGILICPTGNGAVVAVDPASRNLLWAATYPRNAEITDGLQSRRSGFDPDKLMQRWLDGTPMIVDGRVFVTPVESERLYCFDLLTGETEFPPIQRVRMRYLAGVVEDKAILVGGKQVKAHDVQSGRAVWTMSLPDKSSNEQIAGRGFFGGDRFYVPTTTSRILAIDLNDGKIVDEQRTEFELGNLLFVNGHLISQGPREIAVAYGQRSLAPVVEQGLQETPDDPDVLVNKAALLIEEGKRAEAIEWLSKARKVAPDHEGARFLAVFAMLDSLRDDFAAHTEYVEPLKEWIALRPQEIELHTLLARGELGRDEPLRALESLLALSRLALTETTASSNRLPNKDLASNGSQPVMDSWIAARTRQVLQQVDSDQRQAIDERIAEHFDRFRNRATASQMRLLKHFEASSACDALRMRLIERLATDEGLQKAERLALNGLRTPQTDEQRAKYHLRLAEVYRAAEFFDDALVSLDRAEQISGKEPLDDLREDITAGEAAPQPTEWPPYVKTEWNAPQQRAGFSTKAPRLLEVIGRRGKHLQGWQVLSEGDRAYSLRDDRGQTSLIPMETSSGDESGLRQVVFDGGLMVALTPNEIFAVDLFAVTRQGHKALLWQKDWRKELGGRVATSSSDAPPFGKARSTYQIKNPITPDGTGELRLGPVVADTLFVLISGELQAIDVLTGQLRWRNLSVPRAGHLVSDGKRVAVASPRDRGRIEYFAVDDGRFLDQQPWPENEEIWFSNGRHLLTYRKERGNPTDVRLRDLFSDEILLEEVFEEDPPSKRGEERLIKGCLHDGQLMTLLESNGQLIVWDLVAGIEVAHLQLDPIDQLSGVEVVRRGDQLIVLPETRVKPPREPNTLPTQYSHGDTHYRVDGPVVSLSLTSGEKLWEHPFEDGPWGITVGQPSASPLLLFSRARSRISPASPTRRKRELSLLAVDVRTGKSADVETDLTLPNERHTPVTEVMINPQEKIVTARVGQAAMVYTFVAEKPPVAPEEADERDEKANEDKEGEASEEPKEPFDLFR